MEKTKKVILHKENQNQGSSGVDYASGNTLKNDDREDSGYVKKILTEQDVYTSGIIYRYINNVDPNKDLITDTAKIGGPLKIVPAYDK